MGSGRRRARLEDPSPDVRIKRSVESTMQREQRSTIEGLVALTTKTSTGETEKDNRFWTDIDDKEEETHGKRRDNGLDVDEEEEEKRRDSSLLASSWLFRERSLRVNNEMIDD